MKMLTEEKKIRFFLNKIVRDKIPELLKEQGVEFSFKLLNKGKAIFHLKRKLREESGEVVKTMTRMHIKEELADVLTVFSVLLTKLGISLSELLELERQKSEKKGHFNNSVFLEWIDLPINHQLVQVYRASGYREQMLDNNKDNKKYEPEMQINQESKDAI